MNDYNEFDSINLVEQPNNYADCFKAGQVTDDDFSDFDEFKDPQPENWKESLC